jgi:hypothetical protein
VTRYSVSVHISYAAGAERGRRLAYREETRLADVKNWLERMRSTWLGALDVGDPGFIALVVDDDNEPACTFEFGRDPDAAPIRTERKTLQAMRAIQQTTTDGGKTT